MAYNRPNVTERIFLAIRQAKPKRLYFAADGANPGKVSDEEKCRAVRAIADRVDWDCEVKTLFAGQNQGCQRAVTAALNWFFTNEEAGIILEDDCLPAESFFWFCDEMLEHYRNDDRMASITGSNLQAGKHWGSGTYYFSRLCNVWGWASWRRFWHKYDVKLQRFGELNIERELDKIFPDRFLSQAWQELFVRLRAGQIDTWDHQLQFTAFFENALCITPNQNLISNLGFHREATHTNNPAHNFHGNLPLGEVREIKHPVSFLPEDEADYFFLKKEFYLDEKWVQYHKDQTWRRRIKRWIQNKNQAPNAK